MRGVTIIHQKPGPSRKENGHVRTVQHEKRKKELEYLLVSSGKFTCTAIFATVLHLALYLNSIMLLFST